MTVQPLPGAYGNKVDSGNLLSRNEAHVLIAEWITNPKLRLHCYQVATLMESWAQTQQLNQVDVEKWYLAGLLHDADWEKYPDLHCQKILEYLEEQHIDSDILHAIASHSPRYFGVEPVSEMDKMIYAFDELSGLIHAYSLMKGGYEGMEVKGVKKKLKDKTFASGVNREDVHDAVEKSGVELDELTQFIIDHQSKVQAI